MRLRDLIQNRQVQSRIIRDLEDLIKHKGDAIFVSRPMKRVVSTLGEVLCPSIHSFTRARSGGTHSRVLEQKCTPLHSLRGGRTANLE